MKAKQEHGQIGTWLSVTVALALIGFGAVWLNALARGTDEAGSIQTAADAAALAGAQAIGRDAPGQIVAALQHGGFNCGVGQVAAADFADRNGATLFKYCYNAETDKVEVKVRSNAPMATGKHEEASATAQVGLKLGPCVMPTAPTPSPTPTPTPTVSPTSGPTPTPTPTPPPPDVKLPGSCGEVDFEVIFPGDGGKPTFNWNAAMFKDQVKPRLVE